MQASTSSQVALMVKSSSPRLHLHAASPASPSTPAPASAPRPRDAPPDTPSALPSLSRRCRADRCAGVQCVDDHGRPKARRARRLDRPSLLGPHHPRRVHGAGDQHRPLLCGRGRSPVVCLNARGTAAVGCLFQQPCVHIFSLRPDPPKLPPRRRCTIVQLEAAGRLQTGAPDLRLSIACHRYRNRALQPPIQFQNRIHSTTATVHTAQSSVR